MILKNIEIKNILDWYNESSFAKDTTIKFNMKFAYNFLKNIKALQNLNETIQLGINDLIGYYSDDKYSFVNEKGDRFVKEEYMTEYNNKMNDLMGQENEIEIVKMKIEEIMSNDSNGVLSIKDMDMISFMIDE